MYNCKLAVAKRFGEKTTVRREWNKIISHRRLFVEDKQSSTPK